LVVVAVAITTPKEEAAADMAEEVTLAAAVADINATKATAAAEAATGAPEEVVEAKATAAEEVTVEVVARAATAAAAVREAMKAARVSNSKAAEDNGKKIPTV